MSEIFSVHASSLFVYSSIEDKDFSIIQGTEPQFVFFLNHSSLPLLEVCLNVNVLKLWKQAVNVVEINQNILQQDGNICSLPTS